MKIHIDRIAEVPFPGFESSVVATLDVSYYSLIAFDSDIERPTPKPHRESLCLRIGILRPDGSRIEPTASINMVSGNDPPGRLLINDIRVDDAPVGSAIELMRYEILPLQKPNRRTSRR